MNVMRLAGWLLPVAAVVACQSSETEALAPAPCPDQTVAVPVDPVLLAFLGKARAAHHSADILEQRGDTKAAVEVLASLVNTPRFPQRPEAHEVLADTRARLADLESQLGNFEAAMQEVERGMALAKETSYFRGHLFEVRGLVAERHAQKLRERGELEAAKLEEKLALEAFEKAMNIQEQVIEQAFPGDAGNP